MTRKGESITLSLSAQEKTALEEIAAILGCTRGKSGNISGLLRAIACGQLIVYSADSIGLNPQALAHLKSDLAQMKEILSSMEKKL